MHQISARIPAIATTNTGKQASFRHAFKLSGLGEPIFADLDLVEPQANTVADVAIAKVRQAWQITQSSILIQDTGLRIPALGGFPGPYARYAIESLGLSGYGRLIKTMTDAERAGSFVKVTAMMTTPHEIWLWESEEPGCLTDNPSLPGLHDWSQLSQIWIPRGASRPVSTLSLDQRASLVSAHATGPSIRDVANDIADMIRTETATPRSARCVALGK